MPEGHPTIPDDLVSMLDLLAQTIVTTLGFGVAVVNLVRDDGQLEAVSVVGNDDARAALLGSVDSGEHWDKCLAASEEWGRLRFLDHRSTFWSEDLLNWVPDVDKVDAPDAWHPEDALFAPLTASDGSRLGILSVDLPYDGRKPDASTRNALEAFAVSAALAIEHATMRSRAEASEQRFRDQAMSDPLTGVGSRALIMERLRHAGTARAGTAGTIALVFVDLDGFKAVNDEHSHALGDAVLRTVAQRIQSAVRAHDTVARWGGDEFLVLLEPIADESAALGVVQRILTAVAEPVACRGVSLRITASMGVAFSSPEAPVKAESLIRRADAAMYEVKRNGGNGYSALANLDPDAARRLHLFDLLSRAVTEQRVVLEYQPIVRVADAGLAGVEALLRLRDDDGSLVYPDEFLGRAVLPADVEEEVMLRACGQMADWVAGGHDLSLAVNVCARQVADIDTFTATVEKALAVSHLAPERLVCELTEHMLLHTSAETRAGIARLVASGVRFSVDDFGTGYGSMTYVHVLPIHELKIDRSFLAEASSEPKAKAIIRSIAALAGELDLGCVAEGVETAAHHDLVSGVGIPLAQGLYYSPPLDATTVSGLLDAASQAGGPPSFLPAGHV